MIPGRRLSLGGVQSRLPPDYSDMFAEPLIPPHRVAARVATTPIPDRIADTDECDGDRLGGPFSAGQRALRRPGEEVTSGLRLTVQFPCS